MDPLQVSAHVMLPWALILEENFGSSFWIDPVIIYAESSEESSFLPCLHKQNMINR